MERRHVQFALIAFAIIFGSQLLQIWLFPRPPAEPGDAQRPLAAAREEAGVEGAFGAADKPAESAPADGVGDAAAVGAAPTEEAAPRTRHALGSLDPVGPAQVLFTLTSRGAAVERIELAGERYHDQDDRRGSMGHLAVAAVAGGCRIGVVGPGTPAQLAGLAVGDVIERVGGVAVTDSAALDRAFDGTKPGDAITVDSRRGDLARACEVRLDRRPLEVVRPEYLAAPVENPDADPADPLSFRLSLESVDGRSRREPLDELPGLGLVDRDWKAESFPGGDGVRFSTRLPGGLAVAKEYRLVPGVDGGPATLDLVVELAADQPTTVAYALDGPTGLPTEGWWYTARVARDWGTLAVRDVAMRFAGKPSAIVSGLKIADNKLEHPATSVSDGQPLSFAGVDALYFAAALVPATDSEIPDLAEVRPIAVGEVPGAAKKKLVDVTARIISRPIALEPGKPVRHRFGIFAGPKQPDLLARYGAPGAAMDDLVYYGWFGWVAKPMIAILHVLHAVIGNYGIAILLLTVMVRGLMFPVSRKQALSTQKMQALQPEMKAIADKYKDDPVKRNQATQELWKKHDHNPVGGCLPVFIQIPIFMGLYRSLATDVELRQAPLFSSAIRWCSNLAAPDMFWDWTNVLPTFLTAPEGYLGPFLNLFPLATILLFLWQQHLFMPPAVDEQAKVQQQVMKYMMFFMALMFFKVPCGLCLYFIASSLWGIAERLMLPTTAPAAAAGGSTGAGRRIIDIPFFSTGAKAEANGAAHNAVHGGDAERKRRQARKKR
ncbi:MAG: membrane protein insertase YidC [Planctomycetaceae bacterium]|nr:membrane protein insertase YidC [Planctomycetaceae bacterium]